MKRIGVALAFVLLAGIAVAMRPAEGQDNLQDRVAQLETRVAQLEQQVGTGQVASPDTTHTLQGSVTIVGDWYGDDRDINVLEDGACEGYGGYSDLQAGGNVTVHDGTGAIVATGTLDTGKLVVGGCAVPFTIENVPEAPFYSIEIGHRDGYSVSLEELNAERWLLDLTVGN